jgi:hypothetical protein
LNPYVHYFWEFIIFYTEISQLPNFRSIALHALKTLQGLGASLRKLRPKNARRVLMPPKPSDPRARTMASAIIARR